MCRVTAYKSSNCNHRWLTITTRCAPNTGFTTTPIHDFRNDSCSIWGKPYFMKAPAGTCPNCDLKGQYDGNTTRLVLGSGEREIQRNMWGMQQGGLGLVGTAPRWNTGCRRPDVMALGVYQQQWPMSGYGQPGGQYYPVAQRYSYGYGQKPGSGCNLM